MLADPKLGCHRTGFAKKCRKLVADGHCNRWIQIEGTNPVNGETVNRWDCVDNWPITLLIDIARKIANGNLGIENSVLSFRNEMVAANQHPAEHLLNTLRLQKPV